jgi:hypothetical protein
LSGSDSSNRVVSAATDYVLAGQPVISSVAGTITQKALAITGVQASNKAYDGSTAASLSAIGSVTTGIGSETLILNAPVSVLFGDSQVARDGSNNVVAKTVTASGYSLADGSGLASDYQLASTIATSSARIDPRNLTLASLGTVTKVYDGSRSIAVLPAPTFDVAIIADLPNLGMSGNGLYDTRHAGNGKSVSYSGLGLTGSAAGNYSLVTSAMSGTGSVTQRASTIWTGGAGDGKWSSQGNWNGGIPDFAPGSATDNVAMVLISPIGTNGTSATTPLIITDTVQLTLRSTAIDVSGHLKLDITGGITTGSGHITAPSGSINMIGRSPITVGGGGIQAASGVSLAANTADSTSTININGAINGGAGAVNLGAYSNISQNSAISGSAITMGSTSGNIVIAPGAINTVSGGGSIQLSAPQGTVTSSSGNFSGAVPVIADSTPPPVVAAVSAPVTIASTQIAATLQTVFDPVPPPPPPTDPVVVSSSPTSVAAPEVAPVPAPTATTPATSTTQEVAASSEPTTTATTATNAPATVVASSDPVAKTGDATTTSKTEEKSETKPAPKPAVQTVMVANSTVQKPADQVMQVERPKGRLLVCKG